MSNANTTEPRRDSDTVHGLVGHRLTIRCNDRVLLAASIDHDPQTMEQIATVLREIVAMLDGPHELIPEFDDGPPNTKLTGGLPAKED